MRLTAQGRDNNFNLIRFFAASLVLVGHSFALTGNPEPALGAFGFGGLGVDIFFCTSGFLVTASLVRAERFRTFLKARALRIYPALIVANLFVAFLIGPLFTTLPLADYLTERSPYGFVVRNTALVPGFMAWLLPGLFVDNPFPKNPNGSLWTLPWEVTMYAILSVAGYQIGKSRLRFVLPALAALAVAGVVFTEMRDLWMPGNICRMAAMFFVGAAFYVYRDGVSLTAPLALAAFAGLAAMSLDAHLARVLAPIPLTYLVLYLAYVPRGFLGFNKLGDHSYGVYIYAFPVQQALAALFRGIGPWSMMASAAPIVLMLAALSWRLIERPALRLKERPSGA